MKAKSLRLGDFSRAEVVELLGQHTEETGQAFAQAAQEAVWRRTRGQPWLVNALAHETCFAGGRSEDRSRPVEEDDVVAAQEALVARRETHLDQLADKLREGRVRRVVEPLLAGTDKPESSGRDLEYVRDLGLVAQDPPVRIANPIYAEVVPRELAWIAQEELPHDPAWYVNAKGGLEMHKLLDAFQESSGSTPSTGWSGSSTRRPGHRCCCRRSFSASSTAAGESSASMAWGRGRTDLLVLWPGDQRTGRYVVECKVRHGRRSLERTVAEGVEQTAAYMDRCNAEAGCLVVFDRSEERSWADKVFRESRTAEGGAEVAVWGM